MSSEIEKRFKNFDYLKVKQILKEKKFKRVGGFLFKLTSYQGLKEGQSIRIRDEQQRITFTIKQKQPNSYDLEWEVTVNDYEMIDKMLQNLNVKKRYDLFKFREIYANDKNEVVFDFFPGLNPYMEIESKTEKELKKTMELLGLNEEEDFSAKDLYWEFYGITKNRKDTDLTFDNAKTVLSDLVTKNKTEFNNILSNQKKILKAKKTNMFTKI